MLRYFKTLVILFGLLSMSSWLNVAQEQNTPTPPPPFNSVFADDTCHAPCWFGLIPGESTASDVEEMIENTQDIFRVGRGHDNDELDFTDIPVIDGAYRLEWRDFSMRRLQIIPSRIFMENGIVQSIHAKAQHSVNLAEVLEVYGQPDYVQVYASYYCHLYLLYPDNRVVINMSVDLVDGLPLTGIIQNDFHLAEIAYYSPLVAIEAGEVDIGTWHTYLYPSNTPAHRQVSLETWVTWLEDDYIRPCSQTEWDTLTEEIEVPIYPTLTPTPTPTEEER